MAVLAVDAAHWWGPVGYLYRQWAGNVLSDVLCGTVGFFAGRVPWRRHRASQAALHDKMDALHQHLGVASSTGP